MNSEEVNRYCDQYEQLLRKSAQHLTVEQFLQQYHIPADEVLRVELNGIQQQISVELALKGDVQANTIPAGDDRLSPEKNVEPLATSDSIAEPHLGTTIGPYQLLQQVGEGGMGKVYLAEQREPVRREVALKIIKPGMDSRQVIARFEAERQALALMSHQNIARVLDAGRTDDNLPFFVMELVRGVSITEYCDTHRLTVAERLELFIPVCQAIQHAHQKGIIHRDIKPSNVLVCNDDGVPVPKVIDFGVAKAVEQPLTEKTLFTQFGQVIGTLEYMSPEQADVSQLDIDTRSDVYSLGVLLYELLTGSTPIDNRQLQRAGLEEMLRIVRESEARKPSTRLSDSGDALPRISAQRNVDPRKISALLKGDLDWIVLKALEKDRSRRYESAHDLARDIERHLRDEPVEACPPSATYKLRKFARKHRAAIAVAVSFALLLVVGTIVSTWQAIRALHAEGNAESARADADSRATDAQRARLEADNRTQEAQRARAQAQKTVFDLHTSLGLAAGDRDDPALAVLWFAEAARRAPPESTDRRTSRVRARMWGRVAPTPIHALWHDGEPLEDLDFSPSGEFVATLTKKGRCLIWDFRQDKTHAVAGVVRSMAWRSGHSELAVGLEQGGVHVLSAPRWRAREQIEFKGSVTALEYSRNGSKLAIASNEVRVWDASAGEFATPVWEHPKPVFALAFSPTDEQLVTSCADDQARVFELSAQSSVPMIGPLVHRLHVFSRDLPIPARIMQGTLITMTGATMILLDGQSGEEIEKIRLDGSGATTIAPAPDGRHFVVGGGSVGSLQVWDAKSQEYLHDIANRDAITSGVFSPDGGTFASAGGAGLFMISMRNRRPVSETKFGFIGVRKTSFSADNQLLAVGRGNGLVEIYDLSHKDFRRRTIALTGEASRVKLSRDHEFCLLAGSPWWWGNTRSARVYATDDYRAEGPSLEPGGLLMDACFTHDDRQVVTASTKNELLFWDWRTGERVADPIPLKSEPRALDCSPTGELLVAVCEGGHIQVHDAATGVLRYVAQHGSTETPKLRRDPNVNRFWETEDRRPTGRGVDKSLDHLRFSADGKWFVTARGDSEVYVWHAVGDVAKLRYPPLQHGPDVSAVALSRDDQYLATASRDGTTCVWDFETGDRLAELKHPKAVPSIDFGENSRYLVAACADGQARVWDWRSRALASPPLGHKALSVKLVLNDEWVVTAGHFGNRDARIYERRTGLPVSPPIPMDRHGNRIIEFSDPPRVILSATGDARVKTENPNALLPARISVIPLEDLTDAVQLSIDDLRLLAEVRAGRRIEQGGIIGLTTDEWLERWRLFHQRHPDYLSRLLSPVAAQAWHRERGEARLAAQDWFGARWHFDRAISTDSDDWLLFRRREQALKALGELELSKKDHDRAEALKNANRHQID